ncbi:MAG TPA: thioredoxin [Verrucomicrobiae bacterium]|nr:thioredoxin [Verrucomicrobiae bacterium]
MSESKVLACPRCGQKNRVKVVAAGVPHCATCGSALPWLVEISTADFKDGVAASPVPVLADFWAPWCGPCRMVAPAVEKVATDLAGKVKVVKINTDEQPELGQRFGVQSIPTLILFDGGSEKDRVIGVRPAAALRSWVEAKLQTAPR